MTQQADAYYETRCDNCLRTVTVVDEPARHVNDTPHWAEAYTAADDSFALCWQCGRVLWEPILGGT